MKRIGTLYAYELKKIASRKIVWIVGIIMIFLCAFLSFSDLISSSYYGEDEISGYEAMKINREYARNLADRKIDDTLLREMQDYYSREDVEESNDSMDEMDLTAAESKVTYEEIKSYVAEHHDGMHTQKIED